MNQFAGKIALVTGASRGIGRAIALTLARGGAHVLVHCNQGRDNAGTVVAEIRAAGGKADALAADLAAADGAHKLAAIVRELAGPALNILVANAGLAKTAPIADMAVEDFDRLFAVNVRAPYFLVQQLLPLFVKDSSIVMLSSLATRSTVGDISAYAATKGAVETLVRHFAYAVGERGIRVNGVAPGVVDTDMSEFVRTDAGRDFVLGMQALKRVAQPDDISDVVAFLASDAARWISGDIIQVDGGARL
ncbi:SDR family NAD(P)-dependent oxidoreductase [Roseateles koreensis]|uniref:SDR family oxidoreductase n=1 Tax=Roseateles koreensis TaxID=2987526 RepID=A0ABT5KQ03_9BURK|nr:SDR family oxidoreductase [Roseateles koreensis]MDC8784540.1 SDR family oxidoreductase [Roseateles koreensis]